MARPNSKRSNRTSPLGAALLPIVLLAAFCLLPRIGSQPHLLEAFLAAAGVLFVFFLWLRRQTIRAGRTLTYEFFPRKVH